MKEQLFLFDMPDDRKNVSTEAVPRTDMPSIENNLPARAGTETADEEKSDEVIADPFDALAQQRREEIDNKLLLLKKKRGRRSFKDMDEEADLVEIPPDDVLFRKQYYNTRTVAEWFNVTGTQLIKWETEFDVLKPKKNARGDRFFRPEDIKNLELIYHLIRRRKFTTEGARQYLKDNKKGLRDNVQLIETLTKFKQFLTELKAISQ